MHGIVGGWGFWYIASSVSRVVESSVMGIDFNLPVNVQIALENSVTL